VQTQYQQQVSDYDQMVHECAEQGKALMQMLCNAGTLEPLYLYCRKSTETKNGKLYLVRDSRGAPDGCELVTGEGLRINVPYSNYFNWIWENARRAPIMKYGK
jgi:hypothetical protein